MVYELLETGRDYTKSGRELCNLLNIPVRGLTQIIERERREGHPICAATGKNPGYFLAANKEEMESYCRSLWKRAGEIHKTRRACIAALDTLPSGEDGEGIQETFEGL